jgi:hypothetical protein
MHRNETQHLNENTLLLLQTELKKLTQQYGSYLNQEALDGEVGCLSLWVDSYRKGDETAGYYLANYGKILLEKIKLRLQSAAAEIQRLDEESPNSKNFTGGKANRLAKAAKAAATAQKELTKALN